MGKRKHRTSPSSGESSSSSSTSTTSSEGRYRWRRWKTSTRTRRGPDVLPPPGRPYTPPMRDDLRQLTAANSAQSPNSSLDRLADITDQLRRVSEQRGTGVSVKDRDVPNFNPADDDVEMWLSKLEDYRELYGWDEKYVCHIAVNKFRGSAETWYQTLHTVPKTWGEWKSLLANTFPPSRDLHALMTDMLRFRHRPGQNLFEYSFQKLAKIRKMNLNLSGTDEVNLIIGGLDHPTLKLSVRAAGINDPSVLAAYLKAFGVGSENLASTSSSQRPYNRFQRKQIRPLTHRLSRTLSPRRTFHDQQGETLSSEMLCYQCNKSGHKRFNCPEQKGNNQQVKCKYCHKAGHTLKNCFKRKRQNNEQLQRESDNRNSARSNVFVICKNTGKGKFYKVATINGKEHPAFIDFGSEYCLISRSVVATRKFDVLEIPGNIILTAFGGNEILISQKVQCSVQIDKVELVVDLLVVDWNIPNSELGIGQNFTEDCRIRYERHKSSAGKKPGQLHPIEKVPRPFHTIHIDHLGPFIKAGVATRKFSYVWIASQNFALWTLFEAPVLNMYLVNFWPFLRFLDLRSASFLTEVARSPPRRSNSSVKHTKSSIT